MSPCGYNILMDKQKLSKRIKQKLGSYLKSICSGVGMRQEQSVSEVSSMSGKSVQKRRRLTFILDDVLVKLTRKNIVLQEFEAYTFDLQIPLVLEKHISQRINHILVAIFSGKFTKNSTANVPYPIRIITKPLLHSSHQNLVVAKRQLPIKMSEGVDALIEEIKQNGIKSIESTLMKYHISIRRIVFVCHKEIKSQVLIEVLKPFKNYYLFEIQRIMSLDQCVSTILYASKCHQFINVDQQSIIEFFLSELARKNAILEKFQLTHILDKLLEQNYYVEVASAFGELLKNINKMHDFQKDFIRLIKLKYPYVKVVTNQLELQDNNISFATRARQKSTFCENTPLFGIRRRSRTADSYEQSFAYDNILKIEELQSLSISTSLNMQEST